MVVDLSATTKNQKTYTLYLTNSENLYGGFWYICNIFTHFPIKTSFSLGIASHSLVSKESSLKHINDS